MTTQVLCESIPRINTPVTYALLGIAQPFASVRIFVHNAVLMKTPLKHSVIGMILFFAAIGMLFSGVFIAMQFGWLNVRGTAAMRNAFFTSAQKEHLAPSTSISTCSDTQPCPWSNTPEWATVAAGLGKDTSLIMHVAEETGVSARFIAAVAIPEQLRFFTADREVFKRYFEPLKILGTLSQFSLGVTGIKPDTAMRIEEYATDPTSPFYPGAEAAAHIAYPDDIDTDTERYARLTNERDHYYSYLYTALYIKEVTAQWERAGFPIDTQAGVIATLFNLGFDASRPHAHPGIGGAPITLGGTVYAYGELAEMFYTSNELSIFTK